MRRFDSTQLITNVFMLSPYVVLFCPSLGMEHYWGKEPMPSLLLVKFRNRKWNDAMPEPAFEKTQH